MNFEQWFTESKLDGSVKMAAKAAWDASKKHANDEREIVLNKDYGGFELSALAVVKYYAKKGKKVYIYDLADYISTKNGGYGIYKKVPEAKLASMQKKSFDVSSKDYGKGLVDESKTDWDKHRIVTYNYCDRDDEDLIEVIKEIGEEAASGPCASLKIEKVSGRVHIKDHDGWESIEYD